jgi:hypothetical protein
MGGVGRFEQVPEIKYSQCFSSLEVQAHSGLFGQRWCHGWCQMILSSDVTRTVRCRLKVRDLSWLPGLAYTVVIEHGNDLLRDDLGETAHVPAHHGKSRPSVVEVFRTGSEWGGGEVPFNTLIVGSPPER